MHPDWSSYGAENIFYSSDSVSLVPQQTLCLKILEAAQLETRQCVTVKIYNHLIITRTFLHTHATGMGVFPHNLHTKSVCISADNFMADTRSTYNKALFLKICPKCSFFPLQRTLIFFPGLPVLLWLLPLFLHILMLNSTFTVTLFL